jgi:hypothetical protein
MCRRRVLVLDGCSVDERFCRRLSSLPPCRADMSEWLCGDGGMPVGLMYTFQALRYPPQKSARAASLRYVVHCVCDADVL